MQLWLQRAMALLGLAGPWTTHGLRRGCASELLARGMDLRDVMLFGRWLSERSCREYLRKGELSLVKMAADASSFTRQRVALWSMIGEQIFLLELTVARTSTGHGRPRNSRHIRIFELLHWKQLRWQ